MKIIVDADACPRSILQICMQVGREHRLAVWTVASINHRIESDHHIVVDSGSQVADMKILNVTQKGDIVITQDWGLASMLLAKPAYCLGPTGKEYKEDSIEFLMEERELKAKHRRAGGRTKGPKKHTANNDERFYDSLQRIIRVTNNTPRNV